MIESIDQYTADHSSPMEIQDMKVINLTDFPLNNHHISLLKKGLSFSPKSVMNEFEVYKDVSLFLRKVIFKYWHNNRHNTQTVDPNNQEEQEALHTLVSLLQENADSDSDSELPSDPVLMNRPSNLTTKSLKMPPLSKHKWIKLFLDQVQKDLTKINWKWRGPDNLSIKK